MSIESIKFALNNSLDIASFTGVGYLCGYTVNWLSKSSDSTSILNKLEFPHLKSFSACCALFITIDRMIHALLLSYFSERMGDFRLFAREVNQPVYTAIRIGVSLAASIGLFNSLSSSLNLPSVQAIPGCAAIALAIVVYNTINHHLASFNQRP